MKTTAEKVSSTASATLTHKANEAFFSKAGKGSFFPVQKKLSVSTPGDKFEQEADRTADSVVKLGSTVSAGNEERPARSEDKLQKSATAVRQAPREDEHHPQWTNWGEFQRKETGRATPEVDSRVQSAILGSANGGQPLPNEVRGDMETRFKADFSNVRIHTDAESGALSNRLSARAFTYQNHIFFSRSQYQPGTSSGKHLLAHELTHTIQQGHSAQLSPQVDSSSTQPHIQRSTLGEILDWCADRANNLPGFRMFTIVLGVNPINMSTVDQSAANILRALIEFMPGGALITTALDNHGISNRVADWIEGQIRNLGMVGQMFRDALMSFIDSLDLSDLAPWNWDSVWDRAKTIFTAPINRLIAFARGVVADILKFIRDAILRPLAAMASGTRGYDLLKAVLGQDPITGEPVPRNAETLIGGFMKLIGQEEVWQNLKRGNAVARAWAWFQSALAGLIGLVRSVPARIIDTLASLTIQDLVTVAGAFSRIARTFMNIVGDFISWGVNQVIGLLEILFSVVAPGVMPYIRKARATFITILNDPVSFVGNLVRAARLGFEMFKNNIVEHLKGALIKWITGPLAEAGVYIPRSFSLVEIIKLVLSVLGLTWQNIRSKLVKVIPEPVLTGLEKTAGILVTLVKDGPAAAWEQIQAELSELKDQLIARIVNMVSVEVVKAAVVRLISMLNPAGAVIQAIIAIYRTISFFIDKIRQIAAVVAAFIDSISAIASGQVTGAAMRVEQTLANALTVVIAFLARFLGLGNIPERIVDIVKKIRQPIDRGLDKIVAWLGTLLQKGREAAASFVEWWKRRVSFSNADGESHTLSFQGEQAASVLTIESTPRPLVAFLADYETNNKPDAEKKETIRQIRAKVTQIEKIKSKGGSRSRSSFEAEDGEAIMRLFTEIVGLLTRLGSGEPPPPTVVTWAGADDGVGMIAKPLSINPGGYVGSQPAEESNLWRKVRARFPGKYVRGHLLNHHVHGPGTKKNLTPVTIGANNRMERLGESAVKKAVLDENKTLSYSVSVDSFHSKTPDFPDADKLASSIRMSAIVIKRKGSGWENKEPIVSESVPSPLPT